MADETIPDKPLAELAAAERSVNPPTIGKEPLPFDEIKPGMAPERTSSEPMPAVDRLRAFEDKHFGEKAVRINGRIERGSGSPYQMAHPSVRERHGKIEKLIEAEQKLATAHAALIQADTEHEQAEQAVAAAEREADATEQ